MIKVDTRINDAKHHAFTIVICWQTMLKSFRHIIHRGDGACGIDIALHHFRNRHLLHLVEGGDGLKFCHRHLCRHQAREASTNHATECGDATGVLRVVKRDEYIHHFLPSHLRDGGMAFGLGGESGAVI